MGVLINLLYLSVGTVFLTAVFQVAGIKLIDYYFERKTMFQTYTGNDTSDLN